MSTDANKALVLRYIEAAWSRGQVTAVDELFASAYVGHVPLQPLFDRATVKQAIRAARTDFPDLVATVADLVAEADRVVARWTLSGTHQPSLTPAAVTRITIFRIEDGRIVESWAEGLPLSAALTPAQAVG